MNRDIAWTVAALAATVSALGLTLFDIVAQVGHVDAASAIVLAAAAVLLGGLAYGSVVYLVARFGYLRRQADADAAVASAGEDLHAAERVPTVCVLVPSYKEEVRVLRQTVVSAALAEYPSRRIVVLLDDQPPGPGAEADALAATHVAIRDLDDDFRRAAAGMKAERDAFLERAAAGRPLDARAEAARLARLYRRLADWTMTLAGRDADPAFVHVDRFFDEEIVGGAAALHRRRAEELAHEAPDADRIRIEYARLASFADVEIGAFERKRYVNLSHAPSKAMNLNSYIGLLGGTYRVTPTREGRWLQRCEAAEAEIDVPAADYLLTLDADSLVRHDYLRKLATIMMADERVAVAQTPYSTYPGAPTLVERTAGAQTDLQYVVHQGFSFFRAAYWVGANALLRAEALADIRQTTVERGHEVPVFIQDKTVIEDTGSSLDLVRCGWTLHNHPERLAYSATPPDFGALIIQRRRWANGGLIILADLLRYAWRPQGRRPGPMELFMRAHYLCSPTLSSLGVLLLAFLPVDGRLASPWIPLTALPYFLLYGLDLKRCGYRRIDLLRVYALNLMLLPINLAGVLRSVGQIVSGRKSSFGRTPKVGDRTSAPATHVALQIALMLGTLAATGWAWHTAQFYLAAFCVFNAACLAYGFVRFVGLREAWHDLTAPLAERRTSRVPDPQGPRAMSSVTSTGLPPERITSFEGLRGYAVALVFAVHFIDHYFSRMHPLDFDRLDPTGVRSTAEALALWGWSSHYGVDLFFLLSGFLIFRLVARPGFHFGRFLWQRAQRLYPAFAVAMVLYLAYQAVFWDLRHDWRTVLQNAVFLQGLFELKVPAIIVASWSLGFEWLFYLSAPVLFVLARGRAGGALRCRHVLAVGAVTLAVLLPIGPHYARFAMFYAGGLLAAVPAGTARAWIDKWPEPVVVAAYLAVTTSFMFDRDYTHFAWPYAIVCVLLVAKATLGTGALARVFRLAPLRALGNVSYSFYLLHGLVLVAVVDHLGPRLPPLPAPAHFAVLSAAAFLASVAASLVSFRLLEQPYFRRRPGGAHAPAPGGERPLPA